MLLYQVHHLKTILSIIILKEIPRININLTLIIMYTGWPEKKVLLRLTSITFNNEQLKSKFKMI